MDFIERWLHISPDGGDGTFEAAWIALAAGTLSVVLLRRRIMGALRSRPRKTIIRIPRTAPVTADNRITSGRSFQPSQAPKAANSLKSP